MEKARILVVEDQKIISLEIKERLLEMGYEVVGLAKSGLKAIELAKMHLPDLILMDIKIEGDMDGIETADQIKQIMDCPVIFLTAYADDKTIERAKLTEPYAYIVKPLDERELKSAIVIALYKNEISKKLKYSEIKYRTAINTLEGSFYVVDKDYNIIINNANVERLAADQKNGKKCHTILYNSDKPCKYCNIPELKEGHTAARKEFYDRLNNKWYYMISTNIEFSESDKYTQHLLVDITLRKKNEEAVTSMLSERETMLREIHHRVKNNLQLMLSLIRLQESNSSEISVKNNLLSIQNRLNSMALVHENLYSSTDLARIKFKEYIEKLVTNLSRAYETHSKKIKIECNIENLLIPVDSAIPLGIIVNELVTNSIKHAFDSGSGGNIDIIFLKNNDQYVIEVSDNGKGIPEDTDKGAVKGLGLKIFDILTRQLNCKVDINHKSGSHYKLMFGGLQQA